MDSDFGVSRCKLLYLEWISNEVVKYSPGNYIQSLDGRKYKKSVCVYVYIFIYIYTHTWVTLLYSRNWHNTVNQL